MTDTTYDVDGRQLHFHCDADCHQVVVTGDGGDVRWAFGERGAGPGRFETPLGLTLVRPRFRGEHLSEDGTDAAWIAVADYGNRRVQIFELDGAWIATLDTEHTGLVGPPCALRWRAPFLNIEGVEGARGRIHLSAMLTRASTRLVPADLRDQLTPTFTAQDRN